MQFGRPFRVFRLRLRNKLLGLLFPRLFPAKLTTKMVRLGTDYGGWWVPAEGLDPSSVCYCAGVGEDISFDLALMDRFGCDVLAIDPTPRAAAYVERVGVPAGFVLLPVGLGGTDRVARFYAPQNPDHVSHSIVNLQTTSEFFEAPLRSLRTIMRERNDASVDLLKIDIEGAEYEVLDSLDATIAPRFLCVEFDQPQPVRKTRAAVRKLHGLGYSIAKVERFNVSLVRTE